MLDQLLDNNEISSYNFAFIDESAKREIRRKLLKAIAMPGHQIPFASRELPIARGWGTGGLQVTLALIGPEDILKVIDQGCDGSVNAVNLRKLIVNTTGIKTTYDSREATVIQTRHRIPEIPMNEDQILVLQVPYPEPLRVVEPSELETRRMHAETDYSRLWVKLYEDIVDWGSITIGHRYPCKVHGHYIIDPTPIPRWDVPKLHQAETLYLFGAGREKRLYAIPPYTDVEPLQFNDKPFYVENFDGAQCYKCGASDSFLDELYDENNGNQYFACSDTGYCDSRIDLVEKERGEAHARK
jgi:alpha-D-ribose 1-methylphosphonate 5-phosphate C-P lyase